MKLLLNRVWLILLCITTVICVAKRGLKNKNFKSAKKRSKTQFSGLNFDIIGGNYRAVNYNSAEMGTELRNFSEINVENCGLKPAVNYIIGGTETARNEFPFVASLAIDGRLGCTATIINKWWIVTAAHCVVGLDKNLKYIKRFGVVTGAHSSNPSDGENYSPTHLIPHSSFNRDNFHADIALVRVNRQINFNEKVNAICFPTELYEQSTGVLSVVGWGRLSDYAAFKASETLHKLDLPIITDKECSSFYKNVKIFDSFLCTLSESRLQGTCHGDSGGPAFQYRNGRAVLVGVGSFMNGNCNTRMPNVNTEVSHYIDWIYETLKSFSSESF